MDDPLPGLSAKAAHKEGQARTKRSTTHQFAAGFREQLDGRFAPDEDRPEDLQVTVDPFDEALRQNYLDRHEALGFRGFDDDPAKTPTLITLEMPVYIQREQYAGWESVRAEQVASDSRFMQFGSSPAKAVLQQEFSFFGGLGREM
jgi:hypothetical protein